MEQTYFKRFCFAVGEALDVGNELHFLKNVKSGKNEGLAVAGLKNFELYQSGSYHFLILELRPSLTLEKFKANLKIQEKKETDLLSALLVNTKIIGLNRVFKKNPEGNDTIKRNHDYARTVMTLEIKNDPKLLEEYIEVHKPDKIWPQIIDNMDAMGILDMEIYLLGYRAFLIMDTPPEFDMAQEGERWSKLPREQEWQHYVAKFQKVDPNSMAIEKWKPMKKTALE